MSAVQGWTVPGFDSVREAFAATVNSLDRSGGSCALVRDGELVVDLWGGAGWERNTTTVVYSATKGVVATAVNLLVQRGALDPDRTVARYWPEFGAAGKSGITVRELLAHRAGLPVVEKPLTLAEVLAGGAAAVLAEQAPLWEPGSTHGYHALTWGWLVGELVRRVAGTSVGAFVARELGAEVGPGLRIGVPVAEQVGIAPLVADVPRPAERDLITDPAALAAVDRLLAARSDPGSPLVRALTTNGVLPTPDAAAWNDPVVRAAEIPAANAVTNARALAEMYGACVRATDPLLAPDTVAAAAVVVSDGEDRITLRPTRFGLGYQLANEAVPMFGPGCFGHPGAGGSLAFADPVRRSGFAYVTNQLRMSLLGDPRAVGVAEAARAALDR
ncbi:serine hydrolase domain-containing protein [Pseudonocardia sp. NPDC049154]|uniref:serine hydrolase domain-containing protein n=1 Tax=Pseudonocardia sp. NPDC049154 TaxID=3155501 RepID=UPI0033CD61E8